MDAGTCKACRTPLDAAASLGEKNGFALLPCPACGTVTVAPFPKLEELMAFYQSYKGSKVYLPKGEKKIRRAARRIRRLLPLTKGRRFLDVGCNCGFAVKAALNLGLDAHGIDIDAVAVETSRTGFGPYFSTRSIEEYAASGEHADIIHTSEVIEHVPEPDSFVAALRTTLDDGGILFLTAPDGGHWNKPKDFSQWRMVTPPSHIVYYTKKGLRHLFEKHGFTEVTFRITFKPGIRMTARKAS